MNTESPPDEAYLRHLVRVFDETPVMSHVLQTLHIERPGLVRIQLQCRPEYNHRGGAVHGGIIGLVIDNAGFMACASLSRRHWMTTCEYKVQLLAPAVPPDLTVTGRVLQRGTQVMHAQMDMVDGRGQTVAIGVGTYLVLPRLYRVNEAADSRTEVTAEGGRERRNARVRTPAET